VFQIILGLEAPELYQVLLSIEAFTIPPPPPAANYMRPPVIRENWLQQVEENDLPIMCAVQFASLGRLLCRSLRPSAGQVQQSLV